MPEVLSDADFVNADYVDAHVEEEETNLVTDNIAYAKVAQTIRVRDAFEEEDGTETLADACDSELVASEVTEASKNAHMTGVCREGHGNY